MFFPILAFMHIQKIEFLISKHQHTHTRTHTHAHTHTRTRTQTFFSHSLFFSKAFFLAFHFQENNFENFQYFFNCYSHAHTHTHLHTHAHTHIPTRTLIFSCFSTPFQLVTHLWNSFPFQIQFLTKNKFTRNFFHYLFFSKFIYQLKTSTLEQHDREIYLKVVILRKSLSKMENSKIETFCSNHAILQIQAVPIKIRI